MHTVTLSNEIYKISNTTDYEGIQCDSKEKSSGLKFRHSLTLQSQYDKGCNFDTSMKKR